MELIFAIGPGRIGQVTTDIISLYTTVCPVTETEVKTTPTASYPVETPWTTSTVYSTTEYTITKCPASVTNCPVGSKTSSVITYTTYCPVATTAASSAPYTVVPPPYSVSSMPYMTIPPPVSTSKPILSTMTISTCVPSVYTSVITVTSTPAATYPGGPASVTTKSGTASGTGYPVGPKNTTTPYVPLTGGASTVKVGALMAVVGLAALL